MIKVYINDKLTFEGGVRSTGRNIGISPRTISKLKTKEAKHLPKHATCDYIVINGVAFHKKDTSNSLRNKTSFQVGFELNLNNKIYKITNINKKSDGVYYTYNNDIVVRARNVYNNYWTLRIGLKRALL